MPKSLPIDIFTLSQPLSFSTIFATFFVFFFFVFFLPASLLLLFPLSSLLHHPTSPSLSFFSSLSFSFPFDHVSLSPLWSKTAKNTDCSTGSLAHPFARSLAPLTRSLAPDCSLRSRPPLRSLVRSLAHFAHSLARGKVNF